MPRREKSFLKLDAGIKNERVSANSIKTMQTQLEQATEASVKARESQDFCEYSLGLGEIHAEAHMLARQCPAALDNLIIQQFSLGNWRACDIYMFHSDRIWIIGPRYVGVGCCHLVCDDIRKLPSGVLGKCVAYDGPAFPRSRGKGNLLQVDHNFVEPLGSRHHNGKNDV